MTCISPVIGRYVHFKRTGDKEIQWNALCEVVIIGHKYIDCTRCPYSVACNDVTGCEECNGTYQPDCKQACEDGFYGANCHQRCGYCKDSGNVCDKIDDRCLKGDLPNHSNESITVTQKRNDSIQIEWKHIRGISADLSDFYGYLIRYKADTVEDSYTEAGIVEYNSSASLDIEKLKPGREYWIEIKPFRENEGEIEFGTPYSVLKVKTDCGVPTTPTLAVRTVSSATGLSSISVNWQSLSNNDANCYNIKQISVFYKSNTSTDFTSVALPLEADNYIIVPGQEGKYEVKLVENNEGYNSSSELLEIIINEEKAEDTSSSAQNIGIMSGASGGILAVIVVTVLTIFIIIRCRAVAKGKPRKPDETNMTGPVAARNQDITVIEAVDRRRDYVSQEQRSSDVVGYETISEDKDKHVSITCPSVAQYEELTTGIKSDKVDLNQYEGLSVSRARTYENFMVEGPYQERKK